MEGMGTGEKVRRGGLAVGAETGRWGRVVWAQSCLHELLGDTLHPSPLRPSPLCPSPLHNPDLPQEPTPWASICEAAQALPSPRLPSL